MGRKRIFSIKNLLFVLFHLMVLVCLVIFSYITIRSQDVVENWSLIISIIAISLLFIQLVSLIYKKIEVTDFRLWFVLLSYLFMFGRVFLNGFNLDQDIFWDIMSRHPVSLLYTTSLFILCCLQSIFIGFVLFDNSNHIKTQLIEISKEPKNNLMFITGILLLLFSMPFRIYVDLIWIIQAQSNNSYSGLSAISGLSDDFAFLAIPSIIYIVTSGKLKRKSTIKVIFTTVIYLVIVMVLSGDRRYPITAILALFLCYFKLYNIKLDFKKIFTLGFAALFILNLLAVIREARYSQLTSLGNFISTFGLDILFGTSTIYETMAEFGITFFSVVLIFKYVPSYIQYQKGFSFIASIPSILPVGRFFGEFFQKASVSDIINKIEGTPVGASLVGDLYANFSWFAIIPGIIIGVVARKIFNINNTKNIRIECAKYYSVFYILINLVRATFFEIFRASTIVYFIPLLIMWVLQIRPVRHNT